MIPTLTKTPDMPATTIVGRYFLRRYRNRVLAVGAGAVARQLRKQGVPISVARVLLFGRV